jgi:biotin carboxyl carrier protein
MNQEMGQHESQGGHTSAPAASVAVPGSAGLPKSHANAAGAFDVCREIDEVLERVSRLAASDLPPEQFLEQLLNAAMRQAKAIGGAIWAGSDCLFERFTQNAPASALLKARDEGRRHLLNRVVEHGLTDSAILEWINADGSNCRLVSVAAPFAVDRDARGCIELLLPVASSRLAQDRALHLAEAFAELIGDFYTHRQVASFRQREDHWRAFSRFVESLHRPGLRETAIAIANEGRWFSQCDRVGVTCSHKAKCKVIATSSVDRVEARSNLVARMEELADAVLKTNEAIWEVGQPTQRAPVVEEALHNYLEQSHARALVALPLESRASAGAASDDSLVTYENESHSPGVLVLEWFAPPAIDDSARERIELVARHSARALSVAQATERLPLIAVNRVLAKVAWLAAAGRLPRTLWIAGCLLAFMLALMIFPADFEISADGELQPLDRREVFAPSDAVVDAVKVEHGDEVQAGQLLLRLRSAALDFESARLHGEIQTAEKRLAAIRQARLERDNDQSAPAHRRLALTAEEEELKESLASLRRQAVLLSQERAQLDVRSPLTGQVLSWDVARSLASRPVERGQALLSMGNVQGSWSLELCVPDEQIGYLLTAADQAHGDDIAVPVSFLLVAEPGVTYRGFVERIARRGHVDEKTGKPVVRVVARLDEPIEHPRPGAGVVAKIHCGRRSLGFVWLHDAWNSIRRRVLF